MEQKFHFPVLFFFIFLLTAPQTLGRVLVSEQGKEKLKMNEVTSTIRVSEIQGQNFQDLMGSEDCPNGDDECSKRRMIAEAHLDYIYTQHLRP